MTRDDLVRLIEDAPCRECRQRRGAGAHNSPREDARCIYRLDPEALADAILAALGR